MIPTAGPMRQDEAPRWQQLLMAALRDPRELLARLELSGRVQLPPAEVLDGFPMLVPEPFLARMAPGDPEDPLLRQVLPLDAEAGPGGSDDPLGEVAAGTGDGVLRKYRGRALLISTGACAVHCRYCFRRHFPYGEEQAGAADWEPALAAVAADPEIDELILSGGDPLVLSDRRLQALADGLAGAPGIRRLRLHSRLPVVLPQRLDRGFLAWVDALPVPLVLVIHANHAQELADDVRGALAPLRQRGVQLLNQSVLLRGVNDSAAVLRALSERLFELGVLPYYLHQLDPVRGALHFEVTDERARALHDELLGTLPGYLVPRLVREEPGAPSKLPL